MKHIGKGIASIAIAVACAVGMYVIGDTECLAGIGFIVFIWIFG